MIPLPRPEHACPVDVKNPTGAPLSGFGRVPPVVQVADDRSSSHEDIHEHPKLSNSRRIYTSLAAGAMAGALAKTTIAPLDRTKIYFQTHPERRYRISGAIKFLKLTYNSDGFFSLWRGNSATMARIIPYAAIQFMAHEQYKRMLGISATKAGEDRKRPGFRNFLAGSLAGLTGQSLTYPLDRARAVMAVTKIGEYRNLLEVFQRIFSEEGSLGLYRGFVPTMMGVVIYAGASFFTYESLKHGWSERRRLEFGQSKDASPTPVQRLLSGAVAGLIGQSCSYPLDIVRRRMQTARQMGVGANKYATILGTLVHVYKKEGVARGWYKGISMNAIKGPIATGISFTSFDYFQLGLRHMLILAVHEE